MKTLATLEADLWLAQRANRRNPSEENQAAIESIEAEIAKITAESVDTQAPKEPKTNTSEATQVKTSPKLPPAESADAQAPKETKVKKQSAPKKKEQEVK